MTSPIPGVIAWPVLLLLTAVIIGRYWLLRDGAVDKLINRALVIALFGLLLREAWFEHLLIAILPFDDADVVHFARQISFGCILFTVSYIYGIAQLWAGADPEYTWQRQRRYDLVALVSTITILIAGTPARRADELIDQHMGAGAVIAWVAFYLPIAATALLVARISIRELRGADENTSWRERSVYLGVLAIAIAIGADSVFVPVVTALEVSADRPSADPDMEAKAWTFFGATVAAGAVVAVPLIGTVLSLSGWDRTSRYCRRLKPLWRDLTAAVPEIVLALPQDRFGRVEPATRLHRMTVEIRDSLLQLKRYGAVDEPGQGADVYARRVAAAIAAKNAGVAPQISKAPAGRPAFVGARDLTAELQQLLDLAAAWPTAKRQAGRTESPDTALTQ